MAVRDTRVADPLGAVHHECIEYFSHHVYKYVWSPVMGQQLILEKDPAK